MNRLSSCRHGNRQPVPPGRGAVTTRAAQQFGNITFLPPSGDLHMEIEKLLDIKE